MKFAGLTGGIGAGKSTVATRLVELGAFTVDVDQISRDVQQPGQPVFEAMVERWGRAILAPDGTLDRQAVADRVFNDPEEMGALMGMTSEAIEDELYQRIGAHHGTDHVVLLEAALLAQTPRLYGISGLLLVEAPEDVVLVRLVEQRGMQESDARARIANQPSREARLANADFVIDNSGDRARLLDEIDRAWSWLLSLPNGEVQRRA